MNMEYAPAKIVIGEYEFLSDDYRIESISINTGCYDGNVVGVGCAYTATCTVVMQNLDAVMIGAKIQIYFWINETWENLGTFWVNSQPTQSGDLMTINAHGALGQQGDTPFWHPDMFYTNHSSTIGSLLSGITELSEMSTLSFDTDVDVSGFLAWEITVPVKEEYFSPSIDLDYAKSYGITKKDFLAGIATLFGGNISERNGALYIVPKTPDLTRERFTFGVDCYTSDYNLSRETYGIQSINIDYLPTRYIGYFKTDPSVIDHQCQCYSGTDRNNRAMLISQADTGANIKYSQNIECDWIGYSVESRNLGCFMQGDLVYRTGNYTFIGYNENLYAGNIINIQDEKGNTVPFYIGEMTLEWDGGFTTNVSCNCGVDTSTGAYNSSSQSGISSSANLISATVSQNKISFADITFSNVKDSTISGSKFIDGSISGSKISNSTITNSKIVDGTIEGSKIKEGTISNSLIEDSTLTGAKIKDAEIGFEKVDTSFVTDLTASKAYVDDLTARIGEFKFLKTDDLSAEVAKINTLTAADGVIQNIFSQNIIGNKAVLDVLQTNIINADYIKTAVADVGYITADEADFAYANITLGNMDVANIDKTNIGLLFAEVGLLDRATIVEGHVTGFLDSVEVNANKITSGTLSTDRLIIRNPDDPTKSIIYEINNITGALQAVQGDTLNGEVLTDRSVNVDKIVAGSITAHELDVSAIFGNSAVLNEIFANDITATGTITGANLYGTYAEIDSGKLGGLSVSNENGLTFSFGDTKLRIGTQSRGDGIVIFKDSPEDFTQAQYTTEGIYIRDSENAGWDTIITPTEVALPGVSLTSSKAIFDGDMNVAGNLTLENKIIGGKWCYNDTTSYGLYWSSESILRPISSSYKVSLGTSSYPMANIYATNMYENSYRVVGYTYSTSGNFRIWKYRDGTLKILWRKVLSSATAVSQATLNVYFHSSAGETFPTAFTEIPSCFGSVTVIDGSAPFTTLTADGVSKTKFERYLVYVDYATTLPANTILSLMFVGKWK